jgi:hypothetical protein
MVGFSCKSKKGLPDVDMITDIVNETVKQDSLITSVPINIQLSDYYLYLDQSFIRSNRDTIEPPPPPPFMNNKGEYPFEFRDYKSELKYVLYYSTSIEDSLYIVDQVTLNKKVILDSNRIDKRYTIKNFTRRNYRDKWKDKIYFFKIPLLNSDKSIAIIEYDYLCASCGHGREVILKKINNKWTLVQSITTWRN